MRFVGYSLFYSVSIITSLLQQTQEIIKKYHKQDIIKCKRKKYRARRKAEKARTWTQNNLLQRRWRTRKEDYERGRVLDIKRTEYIARARQEDLANSLEEKARKIRVQAQEIEAVNDSYLNLTEELENSDAGTLNLSACAEVPSQQDIMDCKIALQKAATYRDMAERLQEENRTLKI